MADQNQNIGPFSDVPVGERFWFWDPELAQAVQAERIPPQPNTRDGAVWDGWTLESMDQAGEALNAQGVATDEAFVFNPDELVSRTAADAYTAYATWWWGP
ncbi:MAG: hypothetical protein KKB13_27010 [Chloroflexi bacterium]|nr:hypothetical protein [Chloroflexota bacterium]